MSDDKIKDAMKVAAGFDWITPVWDLLVGYNSIEYGPSIDHAECKRIEKELQQAGIKAKTLFDVNSESWRVIAVRRSK